MSEVVPESVTAPAPSRPWGLWAVCMAVVAALLVAWAGDRAKPLVLFPLILGAVFGGAASLAAVWCELPRRRLDVSLIVIGAIAIVPASYYLAAKRLIPSEKITNPLAEQLLKQMEQQAPAAGDAVPIQTAMETYLQRRYRRADMMSNGLCLLGESALAGIAAAGVMAGAWRGRREET